MNTKKYDFPQDPNIKKAVRIVNISILVVIAIIALTAIFSSFYTVNDQQVAVITTFGKQTDIKSAGLHFKIPFIQEARLVEVNKLRSLEMGYKVDEFGNDITVESDSKMITGDYNIVNIDFYIEYQISDPVDYLYKSSDPELLLKLLIQSQIRSVVGSMKVDNVITDGKAQIEAAVFDMTLSELEEYDIGLKVTAVRIQDSEPPTKEVNEAFAAVINAGQRSQTLMNQALQYQAEKEKLVMSEQKKILTQAEFEKKDRVNEANRQISMFNAMYSQYALNRDITKSRMYYEALEKALGGVKLYIDTGDSIQKLLPVDVFNAADNA